MSYFDKTKTNFDKTCNEEHVSHSKPLKRKVLKSSLGILIERTRLSNKSQELANNNLTQTRIQNDMPLSKKKINEILMIMQAMKKSQEKPLNNMGKPPPENRGSVCPFMTKFGENSIISSQKDKSSFEVVKEKMRSKLGKDFYNKIKVNILLSNQKGEKSLENFRKFKEKKKKLGPNDEINKKINCFTEPTQKTEADTEVSAELNLKEYQRNFLIDTNDELFNDYKCMRLQKAKVLLNNSPNYRAILSSEILRFPRFMKKLETESNNSSFLDNYCPLESIKDMGSSQNLKKIHGILPKINILEKKSGINKNNDSSIKKGHLTERYGEKMEEITEDLRDVKKNNRRLRKKVRKETKSMNFKYGSMIKDLNGLKLY